MIKKITPSLLKKRKKMYTEYKINKNPNIDKNINM